MSPKLPLAVTTAVVYRGSDGYRYTCRGEDGRIVYDSERSFRSRVKARNEVYTRWPLAKVTFDIT